MQDVSFTDSIGDRDLEQLCRDNPDFRFETDKHGKLILSTLKELKDAIANTIN